MHSLQIKLSNLKRIHIFEKVISNCYFINSQRLIPILLQYLINGKYGRYFNLCCLKHCGRF